METKLGYADLNPQQRRKAAPFLSYYNDEARAVELALLVKGVGMNSFNAVKQKIYLLMNDTPEKQKYYNALYAVITIGETLTLGSIISVVSKVRRELNLQPYITDLDKNCLDDFQKLFIVEIETVKQAITNADGSVKTKTKKVGFKPIFRLKP